MQWKGRRQSSNVNDQRGQRSGGNPLGGLGNMRGLASLLFSKTGLIIIVIFLGVSWMLGKNPLQLLQMVTGGSSNYSMESEYTPTAGEQELAEFTAVVLADTEDVWHKLLDDYREPTLVLFSGHVQSACGSASSATGPFYCGGDENVYIDLEFYQELKNRFHAPGDFAQAYVIAHEVGHHVQHLMGITDRVHGMRSQLSEEDYNKMSVKVELQADFFAGIWAHYADRSLNILDDGDLEEAIMAAQAIGDDRLQMEARGYVVPDSFTHGTSAQRMKWFRKGFETGDIDQGDTFNATDL